MLSSTLVEDTIRAHNFALSVYEQCRESSGQYCPLSMDVLQLAKALHNAQVVTKRRSLGAEKASELSDAVKHCHELLAELRIALARDKSKRAMDKRPDGSQLQSTECGEMKARLLATATLFATLNEGVTSPSQLRLETAMAQLVAEIQAGSRDGLKKSTTLVGTAYEADEDSWVELVHDLEGLGVSKNVALGQKAFIRGWIVRAIDEGKLQGKAAPKKKKRRRRDHPTLPSLTSVAEASSSGPSRELSPAYPPPKLAIVNGKPVPGKSTNQSVLGAVDALLSTHSQDDFERHCRSATGDACLKKVDHFSENAFAAAAQGGSSEFDRITILNTMTKLGIIYRDHREYAASLTLLQKVCEGWDGLIGNHAEQTLRAALILGGVYELANAIDEAQSLYLEGLDVAQYQLGPNADLTLRFMLAVGRCLTDNWRPQDAELIYQEAYSRSIRVHGAVAAFTAGIAHQLGVCYCRQGKLDEAIALLTTSHAVLLKINGCNDPGTIASARLLGNAYFKLQAYDKARDSWAYAIAGHQALGTLETPLGSALLEDCLALGQQMGHANSYSWKIRRDPIGFLKTLGLDVHASALHAVGPSNRPTPPLPFQQRPYATTPPDGAHKPLPKPDQAALKADADRISAVAAISAPAAAAASSYPRWLDLHDPAFAAASTLQAAKDWTAPLPAGAPEAAQTVLAGPLHFADADRDGPPYQVVEACRNALASLPQVRVRETDGAFRCLLLHTVVVDVVFVKLLVSGVYGLQVRQRRGEGLGLGGGGGGAVGAGIKKTRKLVGGGVGAGGGGGGGAGAGGGEAGMLQHGLWGRFWDGVLVPRIVQALQDLRKGSSESRLENVQGFLRDRLKKLSLMGTREEEEE